MSELVLTWLNDEVQLSTRITNFETDFANGYLFGELLWKYSQQLNFQEFRNDSQRDAKLNNFMLLKPTFRTLKIKYDSQIVKEIIEGKKAAACQLLYQLKMVLEKFSSPSAQPNTITKSTRYISLTPLLKINPSIQQFASMDSKFFQDMLSTQHRSQKSINAEAYMQKYNIFKETQDKQIKKAELLQEQKEQSMREQMRLMQINKLKRSNIFQADWAQKGQESWKKNQLISQQRIDDDLAFQTKTFNKKESKRLQIKALTKSETFKDIAIFEDTLRKQGLRQLDEEGEEDIIPKQESRHPVMPIAPFNRIKEKSQMKDFLRVERDKRRRKMIVDQSKIQRDITVRKREELLLKKVEQCSRQEREIEYEIWRASQCKDIIIENRELRDSKYKKKNEIMIINSKHKEDMLLTTIKQEYILDLNSKLKRQREVQIQISQAHRKDVFLECGILVERLIELSEICFKQQQQLDQEDVVGHFFDDEIKLFINNSLGLQKSKEWAPSQQQQQQQQIQEEKQEDEGEGEEEEEEEEESKQKQKQSQNQIEAQILHLKEQEKQQQDTKTFLAEQELVDYLQGLREWYWEPTTDQATEAQPSANQIDDIPLIKSGQNNWILGDMIVELLRANYVEVIKEAKRVFVNHLDWLPIKLAVLGYQFSGKKTITQLIAAKYGVQELSVDDLIKNLLELKQQDDQSLTQEDRQLADLIYNCLYTGKDIPDECYVQLIMKQVNILHPEIGQVEFLEKYENMLPAQPQQSNIDKAMLLIQDLNLSQEDKDFFNQSLLQNSHKFSKGFILIDFPHTYEQTILLEKQLSGFAPKDDKLVNEYDLSVQQAATLIKPTQHTPIPRGLIIPGIDLVLNINISKRESLRRALGRRIDPLTMERYHLDDEQPPTDSAPLIERLEPVKVTETSEMSIAEKNCELDQNLNLLSEWYSLFGLEYKVPVVVQQSDEQLDQQGYVQNNQDGNENPLKVANLPLVIENTSQIVDKSPLNTENLPSPISIPDKNEKDSQKKSSTPPILTSKAHTPPQAINLVVTEGQSDNIQKIQTDRKSESNSNRGESREQDKDPSVNKEEIFEQETTPVVPKQEYTLEKLISWKQVDGKKSIKDVFNEIDQTVDQIISIKEQKFLDAKLKMAQTEEELRMEKEIERIKAENEQKWLWIPSSEILQDLAAAAEAMEISRDALGNLVQFWKNTLVQYSEGLKSVFFQLNEQKQVIQLFFHHVQTDFLEIIQRPDDKFVHLRQYQDVYNAFVLENPDMCEEEDTKEELHQRVDDLHDVLIDIIVAKQEETNNELNQIIRSEWIEKEMEKTMISVQKLLQQEICRFFNCQTLIKDYYTLKQGKDIVDLQEYHKADISSNPETLGVIEEGDSFPRLEKLIDLTFKLSNGEEENEDKSGNKKGGKAPPAAAPNKKDDKKAVKKGGKEEVVEESQELSLVDKLVQEAIRTEKAIFKQRVLSIKDYSIKRMKSMRAQANTLYEKLQDWINYSVRSQTDAVEQTEIILRNYIEQEKRIQQEIQLHFVDVVISHKTLNFFTPPVIRYDSFHSLINFFKTPILFAREALYKNKFMISQLYLIVEELRGLQNQKNNIESRSLLELMIKKSINPLSKTDLPELWGEFTIINYQRLIRNLDPKGNGYVSCKDTCTYFCLAGSSIPNKMQEDEFYEQLKSYGKDLLNKEQFTKTPAWFDKDEETQIELNTNLFDRPRYLKELIFYIHKDSQTDLIEINLLMQSIQTNNYLSSRDSDPVISFADLLFNP